MTKQIVCKHLFVKQLTISSFRDVFHANRKWQKVLINSIKSQKDSIFICEFILILNLSFR